MTSLSQKELGTETYCFYIMICLGSNAAQKEPGMAKIADFKYFALQIWIWGRFFSVDCGFLQESADLEMSLLKKKIPDSNCHP